ncbi:TonB-dependent receptor [Polaribacter haliotis]|uniref:TonB-dependent receptor n=1 Tax=Polaribacter haliotis TaxID=1888915 RepID=A0A7L8AHI8_9FLAO|nr:TonB-dependent receptor [Polaribacter haliotis]QOD61259.1 TonB-dependent receptor [Polaribacter haliotis]
MTLKFVIKKYALLFLIAFFSTSLFSQKNKKTSIPLTVLLDSISNKHQIFFTYKANLLTNKTIQEEGFKNLNLKESISLLKKLTPFYFDDLGNNYYVIYKQIEQNKRINNSEKNTIFNSNTINDSIFVKSKIIAKGIVLSSDNEPLNGATLQNSKSFVGTTTNSDGTFNMEVQKENTINVSFIGHNSKTLTLSPNKFNVIILSSGQELAEIKIVGSRNKNRVAKDTPVAIDVINIEKESSKSSQVEVNQFLEYSIPSFNATKQSGADGADHIDPATIRGLGPDQTLVLINGKRRHQASLINLYGTRGRGNSGTDLNTIPISAIKRIEILRDGASAQYGSDAIAGVINIVLNDIDNELNISSTIGFNNANTSRFIPDKVDGFTYKLALNYGTKITKDGFINLSTEILSKNNTFREGTSIREKFGQAGIKNVSLFFNSEIPIYKDTKLYANGGFNYKNSEAFAFTRDKNNERNVLEIYENGFNPLITSTILDNSFSFGLITNFRNWNIDINNTFGRNNFRYFIKNTLNATLEEDSPTEFDAGGHQLIQNTTSIDFSKYFKSNNYGFNLALGAEHRLDKYKIFSGEEGSYVAYDINKNVIDSQTPTSNYTMHNGIVRPGGSQGFPGYAPENEVDRDRSNIGIYVDTEFDFSKNFMIGGALRYEYYSDFGNTLNFKLASRYKITPNFNIRSSFSTGFRAPSLAQIYFNLKFTNFIGSKATESLLVANNSPIARRFNINKLNEEKARNFSLGFTTKLNNNFNASIDAYYVSIIDRIILSGNFEAQNLGFGVDNVQFFANGVNTQTTGVDLILNWQKSFSDHKLGIDFSGNINHMSISDIKNKELDQETFFGIRDQQYLLVSAPKSKFNFGINYTHKNLKTSINFTRFSKVKLIDWQIYEDIAGYSNSETERLKAAQDFYNSKITTDLHISYQLNSLTTLQFGVDNLFNIYPTKQFTFTDSGGLWDAIQMGTNGAFYYTKIKVNL